MHAMVMAVTATMPCAAAGVDLFLAAGGMIFRLDSSIDAVLDAPLATINGTVIDLAGSPDGRFLVAAAGAELTVIDTGFGNICIVIVFDINM